MRTTWRIQAGQAAVDQADGQLDGKWRDNDMEGLLQGFDTPARTPYQQRVVEEVIREEGFGADDVPDLLYLNFKEIDYVSHVWSMDSPEMLDAVAQDRAMKDLVTSSTAGGHGQVGDGAHGRPRIDADPAASGGSRSRPARCRR